MHEPISSSFRSLLSDLVQINFSIALSIALSIGAQKISSYHGGSCTSLNGPSVCSSTPSSPSICRKYHKQQLLVDKDDVISLNFKTTLRIPPILMSTIYSINTLYLDKNWVLRMIVSIYTTRTSEIAQIRQITLFTTCPREFQRLSPLKCPPYTLSLHFLPSFRSKTYSYAPSNVPFNNHSNHHQQSPTKLSLFPTNPPPPPYSSPPLLLRSITTTE